MANKTAGKAPLLIVEDNEAWVTSLRAKLKNDYEISSYPTGEEAVQTLVAFKPSIVILDYHLEGKMTGLDTLKEIRRLLPAARVVMFSAQDDVQIAVDTLNNGAYDYVVKGDNALNRLRIILRNIHQMEALHQQVYSMSLRVRRDRFWLGALVAGLLLGCFVIYFNTCPSHRSVKWDPFGVMQNGTCRTYDDSRPTSLDQMLRPEGDQNAIDTARRGAGQ